MVSEEQARAQALRGAMLELLGHPAWGVLERELEGIEARLIQRLVSAGPEEFAHLQGQIVGLRLAFHRPRQIVDTSGG